MRKTMIVLAVVAIVVVATEFAQAAGGQIAAEETFSLTEVTTGVWFNTTGKDPAPGDGFIYRSQLLEPEDGSRIGSDRVSCLFNTPRMTLCTVWFSIGVRGDISAEYLRNVVGAPSGYTMAITGGTGEFENVRGSVTGDSSKGGSPLTFHLLP